MTTADERDPKGMPPLCDEDEFREALVGMVADHAPRVFAVVQEWGTRVDARVAGWGLAHEDHVDVISVDGDVHLGAPGVDAILRRFGRPNRITARLIWPDPAAGHDTERS